MAFEAFNNSREEKQLHESGEFAVAPARHPSTSQELDGFRNSSRSRLMNLLACAGVLAEAAGCSTVNYTPSGSVQVLGSWAPSANEVSMGVSAGVVLPPLSQNTVLNKPVLKGSLIYGQSGDNASVLAKIYGVQGISSPSLGPLNVDADVSFGATNIFDSKGYKLSPFVAASLSPSLTFPLDKDSNAISLSTFGSAKAFTTLNIKPFDNKKTGIQFQPGAGVTIGFSSKMFEAGIGADVYLIRDRSGQWTKPVGEGTTYVKVPWD